MRFEFTDELRDRIFKHFEGMDDEYVDLVRGYHRVYLNGDHSEEYKNRERLITIDLVKSLKKDRADKAKAEIELIKEDYTELPASQYYTTEEKQYNLMLWTRIFPTATLKELEKLYSDNIGDEDFIKLLKAELRERVDKGDNGASTLLFALENPVIDTRFKELDKLVISFNTWANMEFYVAGIKNSLTGVKYREVDRDLAAFPIDDGPTFRPVFRLSITG